MIESHLNLDKYNRKIKEMMQKNQELKIVVEKLSRLSNETEEVKGDREQERNMVDNMAEINKLTAEKIRLEEAIRHEKHEIDQIKNKKWEQKKEFLSKLLEETLSFDFCPGLMKLDFCPGLKIQDFCPVLRKRRQDFIKEYPFDYLFIFSLFLYSGEEDERLLMDYFLARCKHPIACLMNASFIFYRFSKFTFMQNLSHSKLKDLSR